MNINQAKYILAILNEGSFSAAANKLFLSQSALSQTVHAVYYRNQAQGLILDNGVLRSRLQGRHWLIDSLKFYRGGTVELKGRVDLEDVNADVDVAIVFDKYRTLAGVINHPV